MIWLEEHAYHIMWTIQGFLALVWLGLLIAFIGNIFLGWWS